MCVLLFYRIQNFFLKKIQINTSWRTDDGEAGCQAGCQ
jgi:hypothetical protein